MPERRVLEIIKSDLYHETISIAADYPLEHIKSLILQYNKLNDILINLVSGLEFL